MRRALVHLAFVALAAIATRARAEEPVALTVSGSAAPGFSSKSKEGDRPRDTPDAAALLEGLPGLRVRRLGGEASFATLSIRGAASNQVAISFAGVPLTGASDPSLDLATLPLWPGAAARVYRTFAPAHLGGGYLGGIVDIAPMELGKNRTEVYNAAGSFGSYRMRVADTHAIGAFRVGAGVSYHRTEGDFRYFDPFRGIDGEVVRRTNNAAQQLAGVIQARHESDRWTWLLTTLLGLRRDGIGGPFDRPALATHMDRDRQLFAIEARKRDEDGRFVARLWGRRDGRTFEDPRAEQAFLPSRSLDRVLAAGFAFGRSLTLARLTLDPRVDGSFEQRDGERTLPARAPTHARARIALALDATYQLASSTSIVLAARGDVRRDTGERAELLPVAHLGAEHLFSDTLALGAHVGTLARPPGFLELLGDGGIYSPAPGLRSERSYAADLGLRARGARAKVSWEAELVGFAWEVRDLILLRPVGLLSLRAENVEAARIAGGELSVAASTGPVRMVVSYTRLVTEDRTSDPVSRGARLPGRPDHDLTVDASARIGPVTLRYGFDLVSTTSLDRAGTRELPTRVFHGAGARLDLGSVSVIGEVMNLFDQRTVDVLYESGARPRFDRYPISDFLGYPLPGRRFSLSIRGAL